MTSIPTVWSIIYNGFSNGVKEFVKISANQ